MSLLAFIFAGVCFSSPVSVDSNFGEMRLNVHTSIVRTQRCRCNTRMWRETTERKTEQVLIGLQSDSIHRALSHGEAVRMERGKGLRELHVSPQIVVAYFRVLSITANAFIFAVSSRERICLGKPIAPSENSACWVNEDTYNISRLSYSRLRRFNR